MHEAGLARAFAAEVERRGLENAHLRVIVTGGHTARQDFEAAFRTHLKATAPWYQADRLDLVREPAIQICSACASSFDAASDDSPCPDCGGAPLPGLGERLEFEAVVPAKGGAADVP